MIRLRESIEKKDAWFQRMGERAHQAGDEESVLKIDKWRERWRCQNDLFYLCSITGNKEVIKYPEYYIPFCDEVSLQTWQVVRLGIDEGHSDLLPLDEVADEEDFEFMQRMYLCYRTFYKTTIISKVHSLQLMLNFPNIHIVLCHNKQENASDNLVAIKQYFLTTRIKRLFPECIPKGKEWGNMSGFSVATRTDWGRSEETIEAVGVDTEIVGRHYQVAKKNDLVTEKSVTTEEQIKKTQSWDERFNIGNFDDPQRKLQDYEGTRYHFVDLYSVKKNDPRIKVIEIPILKDGDIGNVTEENISNPKRFTVRGVKGLKSDIWTFMCQMMLKPDDPARMQFKREMIQYFTSLSKGLNYYMCVDPATARKKRSDYTVILIIGIDVLERKWVVDGYRDKVDPTKRINLAIELAERWEIKGCGWESVGFQEIDAHYLEEVRRKKQLHFLIEEIKSHKIAKEDRIRGLVPEYAQNQWFWPEKGKAVKQSFFDGKNYDLTEEIEREFLDFPLGEHDDLLDAMTFINRITTIKPIKDTQKDYQGMTFGEYAKLKEDRIFEENKDPFRKFTIGSRV